MNSESLEKPLSPASMSSLFTTMKDWNATASRKLALNIHTNKLLTGIINASTRVLHSQRQNHTPCPFNMLIDDVILYMAEKYLGQHEIWALSLVARRYNTLLTPRLYFDVQFLLRKVEMHRDSVESGDNRKSLLASQKRFRRTLDLSPRLNLSIRSLEWYLDNKEIRTAFLELLAPMKHLKRIYLCTPYGSPLCPDRIPPFFVPRYTSVTLEGIISLKFAKLIINPDTIRYLSLDFNPRWMTPILDWVSDPEIHFPFLTTLELRFPGGNRLMAVQELELLMTWKHALEALCNQLVHVIIGSRITKWEIAGRLVSQPTISSLHRYLFPVFFDKEWCRLQRLTLWGASMVGDAADVYQLLKTVIPQVEIIHQMDPTDSLWLNHFAYNQHSR